MLQTEHDVGRLDDREISFTTSLCARLYLFSGRVGVVGSWGVDRWDVQRGGGLYSRDELPAGRRGEAGGPNGRDQVFVQSLSLSPLLVAP